MQLICVNVELPGNLAFQLPQTGVDTDAITERNILSLNCLMQWVSREGQIGLLGGPGGGREKRGKKRQALNKPIVRNDPLFTFFLISHMLQTEGGL